MSTARRVLGLSAIAATAGLLLAPGAHARTLSVQVALPDSNGYRLSIGAGRGAGIGLGVPVRRPLAQASVPQPIRALAGRRVASGIRSARPRAVRASTGMLAIHVRTTRAASMYSVPATVTHDRLRASLGRFGRVFLRFHLHRVRTHRFRCARVNERIGTFTGNVRFRGEDGYVTVDAGSARGRVKITSVRLPCPRTTLGTVGGAGQKAEPSHLSRRDPKTGLHAKSGDTAFVALKAARRFAGFIASTTEPVGRVVVARIGVGSGKASEFRVNRRLTSARITPSPAIFEGSANFEAPRAWTGPLTASLPGAPHLRLAGHGFRAKLVRVP